MEQGRKTLLSAGRVTFGPFTLSITERLLLRDGEVVQIGSRSLDILIALARNAGKVVANRDLIDQVWDGIVVNDSALRVHIAGLRKSLRDGKDGGRFIDNVSGRGYVLVAAVTEPGTVDRAPRVARSAAARLPPISNRMIGRNDVARLLATQIFDRRFVSLVGPGGVGKTTVAINAADQLRKTFDEDVVFANLSFIADPALVHVTVASMLGLNAALGDPVTHIVDLLKERRVLLVLDNCEHLIEPVAVLAERLFAEALDVHLLTTTREPLRVHGEYIVRLASLDCPPSNSKLTAAEILSFPAVDLFVERVSANLEAFRLTEDNAPIVADVCRKLDGIPLAIELAAGSIEAYGLPGMAQLLERHHGLTWRGHRTAPFRHQTLHAMLEWSYGLLEDTERTVFARIAIFAGHFDLTAARAVASDNDIDGKTIVDIIGTLVAKSLISVSSHGAWRYRLLDTTRAYAFGKLVEGSDLADIARRHAQFFAANAVINDMRQEASVSTFIDRLADVRSALEWCFSESGDKSVGVTLVAATATPFLEHSLCKECHHWTQLAIVNLAEAQRGTALELELQTSLGWSAMFSAGNGEAVHGAFLRGLEISKTDPDPHQQLRLLNGLSFVLCRKCDFLGGLELAEQASKVARQTTDSSLIALADWALGVCQHLCGHQADVEQYCESALTPSTTYQYARNIADYGYDYRGRALVALARSLWLRGYPDRARGAANFAIEVTGKLSHPVSLIVVLVYAATVFIWSNDWEAAEATIDKLLDHSQTGSLVYRAVGAALKAMMNCRRGADKAGIDALRLALDRLIAEQYLILVPHCQVALAEALLAEGNAVEASHIIDDAMNRLEPHFASADGPEVLRVKGLVTAALGDVDEGIKLIARAVELAQKQSALFWELRACTSLARISTGADLQNCLDRLALVCERCGESYGHDDLKVARSLVKDHPRSNDAIS